MPIQFPWGETQTITVPARTTFPVRLAGIVQHTVLSIIAWLFNNVAETFAKTIAWCGWEFLEAIEPESVAGATPILDAISDTEGLPSTITETIERLKAAGAPAWAIAALAVLGMFVSTLAWTYARIAGRVVEYDANERMPTQIPDVSLMINLIGKSSITYTLFEQILKKHGYDEAWSNELVKLADRLPDPTLVLEAEYVNPALKPLTDALLSRLNVLESHRIVWRTAIQRLLNAGDVIALWQREEITPAECAEQLKRLRYADWEIDRLKSLAKRLPGPADLVTMAVREAFSPDVVAKYGYDQAYPEMFQAHMAHQGYEPEWSRAYWRAHWRLPTVQQGYEMLWRIPSFKADDLEHLMRVADIPPFWRRNLQDIAYQPLTRVDVRRMYRVGVLKEPALLQAYKNLGYNDVDAEYMKQFTMKYELPETDNTIDQYRKLTQSIVVNAYRRGVIDETQATESLTELKYSPEDIDIQLRLARWEEDISHYTSAIPSFRTDVRNMIERAYALRLISAEDALSGLTGIGYPQAEAELLIQAGDMAYQLDLTEAAAKALGNAYVNYCYSRTEVVGRLGQMGVPGDTQDLLLARWDAERDQRYRKASVTDYKECLAAGVLTMTEFQDALRGLGYSPRDAWIVTVRTVGAEAAGPKPDFRS